MRSGWRGRGGGGCDAAAWRAEFAGPGGEPLVQHRAIRFRWQEDTSKPSMRRRREPVGRCRSDAELRAPAVTAACMLITARVAFARVGGFDTAYRYGTEDVDLGLKLLAAVAQSAGAGRSVLIHSESSSQNRAGRDFRRLNRDENRGCSSSAGDRSLLREYRLARLRCDPFWTDGAGAHVAITLTSLDVSDGWGIGTRATRSARRSRSSAGA